MDPSMPLPRSAHRGQLILVTALSLAVLFVSLALILNTAIYTENLATRSSDIGGGTDAVRYVDASREGVGGAITYVNAHNNSSYDTLRANLSSNILSYQEQSALLFAKGDRAIETDLATVDNGTRLAQTDSSRNFTNISFAEDWTLAENISQTRSFTINVTDEASLDGASGEPFEIVFANDSDTWRLNVTHDGNTTEIGIKNGSDIHFICAANNATPVIDVTAGTINGTTCEGLTFAEGIDRPYSIRINHGSNITGTYSMVVNNTTLAANPTPHFPEDSGQPFVSHAIYSANVSLVYQTPRLHYDTTVRIAPGEANE